jgi:XRE family transcriptional regulator, regulator of sulfur utilization
MQLKDRLAELRREHDLTLRELRDQIEAKTGERLSISYLSELERVEAMPSIDIIRRIARGYDLSLQDLLAPVDFFTESSDAQYPASLVKFVKDNKLDREWLETLSRIEFRGQRPKTADDWLAIYGVLKRTIEPGDRS